MKSGGPTPSASVLPTQRAIAELASLDADRSRSDTSNPYGAQREAADRDRRRAEPNVQDGRYGFENKNDQMEVGPPPVTREESRRPERQDTYHDNRPRGRDSGYDPSRQRGYIGSGYYDRGWDSARPRNDRRLYSDGLYSHPRGSGYS